MMKHHLLIVLLLSCFTLQTTAQTKRSSVPLKHGAHRIGKRTDIDMENWRNHGLGQFIHWGIYSIPGGHWNGKYYDYAAEQIRTWDEIPDEEYDNLYKQFNPKGFNARQWAGMAKEMGARYMIITTKHHDGFCMWPSQYTDYTVANTPYKKDILREIIDAYNKEGIDVHLYFSIIDWNHPDYRSFINSPEDSIAYERFLAFTRNQLLELARNYPTAKGFWFDGTWVKAWIDQAEFADNLETELRELLPNLLIGSRYRADENGKRHYDTNGDIIGDYDQAWERDLPQSIEQVKGVDWDCVMTVPENQWGYHSDWRGHVKTSYELLEMLAKAVSMDGNFVLNFGPDGNGNIREEEQQLAKEIGNWMKTNHPAIYGCKHADIRKQDWGYFTSRDNKRYMIVFNRPINDLLHIEINEGGVTPAKATLLDNNSILNIKDAGRNKHNSRLYNIVLPKDYQPGSPFVIELEVEQNMVINGEYQQANT